MASADEEELESAEKVSDYDEYEELSAQVSLIQMTIPLI